MRILWCLVAGMLLHGGAAHAASLVVNPADRNAHATIAAAVSAAGSGDTITIKKGVYRETIKPKPHVTIEGETGALVKGSDIVSGWKELREGVYVKRDWAVNSQQVFVDGVAMRQIGGQVFDGYPGNSGSEYYKLESIAETGGIWPGRVEGDQSTMPAASFFYDGEEKILYLRPPKGTLSGRTVEVSVRPFLVHAYQVDGFTLRNLSFSHSNSSAVGRAGALRLIGNNLTVDKINVTWTDSGGMTIRGDNNIIRDSVFSHCGQIGVTGSGKNVSFAGNEMSHNNQRGFNKWWEAGGVKFMGFGGMQGSTFIGNRVLFNNGDAVWYDGGENRNNRIDNNVVAYNEGSGIHYEVSYGAHIARNYVFGNKQRGIYIANSADSLVEHNLVAKNGLEGVAISNEAKRTARFPPKNNKVLANIIGWSGKHALRLPNAEFSNFADGNLFVGDGAPAYGIWEAPAYPTVSGLVAWQAQSGQ
ncbi:MAG: right-handed parallel beta-helix repeat-containing protein, partial [Burkholderiales bacterium]